MSITGLVVRARPERADRVAEIISGIDGVEVHTVTQSRWFCVQCHSPQSEVGTLVPNTFKSSAAE